MKNTTQQLVFHVFDKQFVVPFETVLSFDKSATVAWAAADSDGSVYIYLNKPTVDYYEWDPLNTGNYIAVGSIEFSEDERLNDAWADTLVEIKLQ